MELRDDELLAEEIILEKAHIENLLFRASG
jgi:hypothetical protein